MVTIASPRIVEGPCILERRTTSSPRRFAEAPRARGRPKVDPQHHGPERRRGLRVVPRIAWTHRRAHHPVEHTRRLEQRSRGRTFGSARCARSRRSRRSLDRDLRCLPEGCHQFKLPKDARQVVPSPMQNTHAEWRASSHANTPCQGCHMPLVEGVQGKKHHNHDFRVVGDAALLRRALRASAERSSTTQVTIKVESGWIGHALPTGDMFRRLQVRATAIDPKLGAAQGSTPPVDLARTFRDIPVHPDSKTDFTTQRVEGRDTRIGPPGTPTDHRDRARRPWRNRLDACALGGRVLPTHDDAARRVVRDESGRGRARSCER